MRAVVGIDFAGRKEARDQRRKIVAISACTNDDRHYQIRSDGFNTALLRPRAPGWTAEDLSIRLIADTQIEIVAIDVSFSIPHELLQSPEFAALVNRDRAFETWDAFHRFVADAVPLAPPLDLSVFEKWRSKDFWTKRKTDRFAVAQPPLKDRFQSLFNMTLLGASFLSSLRAAGFALVPFDESTTATCRQVIEAYPGHAAKVLGRADYKRKPREAIAAMLEFCRARNLSIEIDPDVRRVCETYNSGSTKNRDPDASDALLACCIGILYRAGKAIEMHDPAGSDLRSTEGVIWSCGSLPAKRPKRKS